jgi:hypothetical protein
MNSDSKAFIAAAKPTPAIRRTRLGRRELLALLALLFAANFLAFGVWFQPEQLTNVPLHAATTLARCRALHLKPAPPPSFNQRTESDRFQPGTRGVLIQNATIWTGRVNGFEVLKGDIFMSRGLIVATGVINQSVLNSQEHDIIDAQVRAYNTDSGRPSSNDFQGAWVTPGSVRFLLLHIDCQLTPSQDR